MKLDQDVQPGDVDEEEPSNEHGEKGDISDKKFLLVQLLRALSDRMREHTDMQIPDKQYANERYAHYKFNSVLY